MGGRCRASYNYYQCSPPVVYCSPPPVYIYCPPLPPSFRNVKYYLPTEGDKYSGIIKFDLPTGTQVNYWFIDEYGVRRPVENICKWDITRENDTSHCTVKIANYNSGVIYFTANGQTRSFLVRPYMPPAKDEVPPPKTTTLKPPPEEKPKRIENFPTEILIGKGMLPIPKDAKISIKRAGTMFTGGPEYSYVGSTKDGIKYDRLTILPDGSYEAKEGAEGKYKVKINGIEYDLEIKSDPKMEEAKRKAEIIEEAKKILKDCGIAVKESAKDVAKGSEEVLLALGNNIKSVASDVSDQFKDILNKIKEKKIEGPKLVEEAKPVEKPKPIEEPKLESNTALVIAGESGKLKLPDGVKLKKITKEARPGVLPNGRLAIEVDKDEKDARLEGGLKIDQDGNYQFDSVIYGSDDSGNPKLAPGKYIAETAGGQKIEIKVEPKLESPKQPIVLGENGSLNLLPGLKIKEIKKQPGLGTIPVEGLHGTFKAGEKMGGGFQMDEKGNYKFLADEHPNRACGEHEVITEGGQSIKIIVEPKVNSPKEAIVVGKDGKLDLLVGVKLVSVKKAPRTGVIPSGSLSADFSGNDFPELEGGFQINQKGVYKFNGTKPLAAGEYEAKTAGGQVIKFKLVHISEKAKAEIKDEAKKVTEAKVKVDQAGAQMDQVVVRELDNVAKIAKTTSEPKKVEEAKKKFQEEIEVVETLKKKGELVKAAKKEVNAVVELKKAILPIELTDNAYKKKIEEGVRTLTSKQNDAKSKAELQTTLAKGSDGTIKTIKDNSVGWYPYAMLGGVARLADYFIVDRPVAREKKEQKMRYDLADDYKKTSDELGDFVNDTNKLVGEKKYKDALTKVNEGLKHSSVKGTELNVKQEDINKKVNEMIEETRNELEAVIVAAEKAEQGLRIAKDKFAEYSAKVVSKRTGVPEEVCKLAILSLSNLGEYVGDIASGNKTPEDAAEAAFNRAIDDCVDAVVGKLFDKSLGKVKLPKKWGDGKITRGIEGKVKDKIKEVISSVISNGVKKTFEELKKEDPDFAQILKESIIEALKEKIPSYNILF